MIYAPGRFAFIHIPRTAGNSISAAIAESCVGRNVDIIIGTASSLTSPYHRHQTAYGAKILIEEWDDIYKFAVRRDDRERKESTKGLMARDYERGVHFEKECPPGYRDCLESMDWEDESFLDRVACSTGFFTLSPMGEDLGVELWDYESLNECWPEICRKCNIPLSKLPRLNSSKE